AEPGLQGTLQEGEEGERGRQQQPSTLSKAEGTGTGDGARKKRRKTERGRERGREEGRQREREGKREGGKAVHRDLAPACHRERTQDQRVRTCVCVYGCVCVWWLRA